jgi:hypothetical protein
MEKMFNLTKSFVSQLEKAALIGENVAKIDGTSGYWLVKADTPEAQERENSKEALIVFSREIKGQKYFICRR